MRKLNRLPFWPGLVLALLLLVQALPVAQADGGTATITVVAPGAAIGQAVEVQWGDPLGNWHTVQGWKGTLDHLTPQGEAFTRWTVFSGNFAQKPFRWVIYNPGGQTLWAVGPWFALPGVNGQDYAQRLDRQSGVPAGPVTPPAGPTPSPVTPTPVAPVGSKRVLAAHTFTFGLACFGSNCSDSKITALIGGLPSSTWLTVQWQDGLGQWHTVDGWQSIASSVDANGVLFQQWDIGPELFGRGPFRWVLYTFQGGSLVGMSPDFNMPVTSRLNLYMSMAVN